MTLSQLIAFVTAAKHGNVTQASKELRITQSAVSRQIKLLEEQYRLKLYRRAGNGIELTKAGSIFLSGANVLLSQVATMDRRWNSISKTEAAADSLTVGGSYGPSAFLLPALLAVFKKSHPQVTVTLRTHDNDPMEQLVLESEVDIALITAPSSDPRLIVAPFRKEKLVVFASVKHPLAKRKELTPAELAAAPLILRQGKGGRGGVQKVLKQLEKEGLSPNIAMRCESSEGVKTQVKMGVGLGILYEDLIEFDLKSGHFKAIRVPKLDLDNESFIVYRKDKPLSANALEFLNLLRQWRHRNQQIRNLRGTEERRSRKSIAGDLLQ